MRANWRGWCGWVGVASKIENLNDSRPMRGLFECKGGRKAQRFLVTACRSCFQLTVFWSSTCAFIPYNQGIKFRMHTAEQYWAIGTHLTHHLVPRFDDPCLNSLQGSTHNTRRVWYGTTAGQLHWNPRSELHAELSAWRQCRERESQKEIKQLIKCVGSRARWLSLANGETKINRTALTDGVENAFIGFRANSNYYRYSESYQRIVINGSIDAFKLTHKFTSLTPIGKGSTEPILYIFWGDEICLQPRDTLNPWGLCWRMSRV